MKISCPTCAAKYSVADEKIQSRLAKIRCRKCSSTIVIDGMTTPANVYIGDAGSAGAVSGPPHELGAAEPAPGSGRFGGVGFSDPASGSTEPVGPAADEYAVDIADNDQRNMTIHQIVGAYNEGLITADTYIWKEGMADWQTLSEVRAVANALHAAARPATAAMPAAVRRADHGAAADLFGRIETAGGEDDITTSAPEPAFSAGTGARNESSVLFSLSALTGTPDPGAAQPGAPKRRASADDSGLIDLQALTAGEASAGGGGAYGASAGGFGASPLISAPLGGVSGPVLGSPLAAGYGNSRSGGRAMIIAASVLAVGILAAAAVIFVKPGNDETDTTSSLDKAAAAAPEKLNARAEPGGGTVPAAVRDQPEPGEGVPSGEKKDEVTKNVVAADELPAAPEPAAVKAPVQRAPVARPRTPSRAKPAAAAPAPAPEPPADTTPSPSASGDEPKKKKKAAAARCECKPADLMCAMRCSAKK